MTAPDRSLVHDIGVYLQLKRPMKGTRASLRRIQRYFVDGRRILFPFDSAPFYEVGRYRPATISDHVFSSGERASGDEKRW